MKVARAGLASLLWVALMPLAQQSANAQEEAPPVGPSGIVGTVPEKAPTYDENLVRSIIGVGLPLRIPRVATPSRVRVSQGVMQRFLVSKVLPEYPAEASERHIGGQVVLNITIDKEGNVSTIEPESGDPLLIKAAVDAVKQWKYTPYLLVQTPVEVETMVIVNFIAGGNRSVVVASI